MTKDQAKNIVLTDLLLQAYNTLGFLHGCLTEPKSFCYKYPEQTGQLMQRIDTFRDEKDSCPHSFPEEDCPACTAHKASREELLEALELLSNPD